MTIVALEFLTFGLGRLASAARARGEGLCLLTGDRSLYDYELSNCKTGAITVIDVDTFDVECVKSAIDKIDDVRGLINTTDTWSLPSLEVAKRFGFSCQNPDFVGLVRDKFALRKFLCEYGLSTGKNFIVNPEKKQDIDRIRKSSAYPLIVKDSAGTGSQYVWLAETERELMGILEKARAVELRGGHVTIEPYFIGTLYSAEALAWEGETRILAISSRIMSPEPMFREEAASLPVRFGEEETQHWHQWLSKVLDTVGCRNGFSHTEFIVTRDGFEIVEINPRLGGCQIGEALCRIYETNIYDALIDMALGRRPSLLDSEWTEKLGFAMALLCAGETGRFLKVTGLERIADHPGDPCFYPTAQRGKTIPTVRDQRAGVGIVTATGLTSEIAMHNVLAARNKLDVRLEETTHG